MQLPIACVCILTLATGPAGAPVADPAPDAINPAQAALEQGLEAVAGGDYPLAIEKLEEAKGLDPALDVDEDLAMAHFRIGTNDYGGGRYQEALAHFQDAQGMYPSPKFHYNIGQCYEALDRPQQAVDSYEAYLRAEPASPDRPNIENKIERLKRQLELRSQAANPPPTQNPLPAEPAPPDKTRDDGRPLLISGAVLLPLGAIVAGVGGTVFGLRALDRSDRVSQVFEDGNPEGLTFDEVDTLDLEGQQAQTLQVVSFAVGGAVALTGAALLAVGISKKRKSAAVSLSPTFAPRFAGIAVGGRF